MRKKTVMNVLITQTRPHGFVALAVALGMLVLCNQVFAMGGYWKPIEGKSYTVRFTDEAKNIVVGEFKKTVRWEWDKDGAVTITEWDDEATFAFKDEAGKEQQIGNATIKARIANIDPSMAGKLKGDIKDAINRAKVTGVFQGVSFWATDGGRKIQASGGSGVLKNENNEVVADGNLTDIAGFLVIGGKKNTSFSHKASTKPFEDSAWPKEAAKDFASIEFSEGGRWTLRDDKFLFVLEIPVLNRPEIVPELDKSLARASVIALPKGTYTFWGYTVAVEKPMGTVKFAHGKIVDANDATFQTRIADLNPSMSGNLKSNIKDAHEVKQIRDGINYPGVFLAYILPMPGTVQGLVMKDNTCMGIDLRRDPNSTKKVVQSKEAFSTKDSDIIVTCKGPSMIVVFEFKEPLDFPMIVPDNPMETPSAKIGWKEGLLSMVKDKGRRVVLNGWFPIAVADPTTKEPIYILEVHGDPGATIEWNKDQRTFKWTNITVKRSEIPNR